MRKNGHYLFQVILFAFSAWFFVFSPGAMADEKEGTFSRPVIEYTSGDLRDPFADLLKAAIDKEKEEQRIKQQITRSPSESLAPKAPLPSLDKFKVQGVIWGGRFPQAIINNQILRVGDSIEGVKIADIDKNKVILNFAGRMVDLPTPGISADSEKSDKEE